VYNSKFEFKAKKESDSPSMVTAIMQSADVKGQIKCNIQSCHKYRREYGQLPPQFMATNVAVLFSELKRGAPFLAPQCTNGDNFGFPQVYLATPGT
jgi:hypothetical protein